MKTCFAIALVINSPITRYELGKECGYAAGRSQMMDDLPCTGVRFRIARAVPISACKPFGGLVASSR